MRQHHLVFQIREQWLSFKFNLPTQALIVWFSFFDKILTSRKYTLTNFRRNEKIVI
jgi:hypothetical protein